MTFVSYAQNYEDVVLHRALSDVERGAYIDVGAQDPVADSVTKAFYERGWRGINIEPIDEWFVKLIADRREDVNLAVAASDSNGFLVLHEIPGTGMTTEDEEFSRRHKEAGFEVRNRKVEACTLDSILAAHPLPTIHFLKIDVEGAEGKVLRGIDLSVHRPWIILLESTEPNSSISTHEAWEHLLTDRGYRFALFDGLNRFYIADELFAQLYPKLVLPPNYFDRFVRYSEAVAHARARDLEALLAASDLQLRTESEARRLAELAVREMDALRDEIDRANATLKAEREKIARTSEQLRLVESQLRMGRQEGVRLERAYHESVAELARLKQILANLYTSRSWRMTRPLRVANLAVAEARKRADDMLQYARDRVKGKTRRVLEASLGRLRRSPAAKSIVATGMKCLPPLDRKLRAFAHARPPAAGSVPTGRRLTTLTCQTRTIYYYVDHTVGCPVNTGMQRVTRGLARSLLSAGEQLVFVKWDDAARSLVQASIQDLEHLSRWQGPRLGESELGRYRPAGEVVLVQPQNQDAQDWLLVPEVTHINHHGRAISLDLIAVAQRIGLRTAFIYYDAIPLRRREFDFMANLHLAYSEQLLLADLVLPISSWSSVDLTSLLSTHSGVPINDCPPIIPTPLPADSYLGPRVTSRGPSERLILAVGTIEPRKNQLALLNAFERFVWDLHGEDWKLVLVGNVHPDIRDELEAALARNPKAELAGNIDDEQLELLYARCRFTVFPSLEEGFGLPIAESIWHGKPCICANFGAMAEVAAGGGCLMVDVGNDAALLDAIRKLACDDALLERLRSEAVSRPMTDWDDYGHNVASRIRQQSSWPAQLGTVYYFVEHTRAFPYNTGIQRVARGLAKALMELDVALVAVKWNAETRSLEQVSEAELDHLALWNGPAASCWTRTERFPDRFARNDWLIVPELTAYPGGPDLNEVTAVANARGLRSAVVFFDAIPWKMADKYEHSTMHATYMRSLVRFNRTLAISRHSRNDLVCFLRTTRDRAPDLERRVVACPLPGEFPDTPRVTHPKARDADAVRILCVGSVERRKNHTLLLQAFKRAAKRSPVRLELCIAGGCHLFPEQEGAFRALLADLPNVRWEEKVSDARLQALYDASDFTIYPSLEEGFGLPILESLWHARPCICRDSGAMAEVAEGGGCLTVDTADVGQVENAIVRLAKDPGYSRRLAEEATSRHFRTWTDYAIEVARLLVEERPVRRPFDQPAPRSPAEFPENFANLRRRPLLSLCISTYNRAAWLDASLANLFRLRPEIDPDLEILVCDNASTDSTSAVVTPYLGRADFRYVRNARNVGMLGNLRCTAHASAGRYVWILGDDDLVKPGAIEHVMSTVRSEDDLGLVYLNYAYTQEDNPRSVEDVQAFLDSATPIVLPTEDRCGTVREIATESENFFTAIYCLVFRRDHALRAYTQNTDGRPFSTMLTAIPTTYYVLHHMMDERACWVGTPKIVVNMNVSWLKYAPLWILERIPEVYDRAETFGADPSRVDRWRRHTLPGFANFFGEILREDPEKNAQYFSPARAVARFKHLPEFGSLVPELRRLYEQAREAAVPAASEPVEEVFAAFTNETVKANLR